MRNSPIRIVIVDDERLARERIRDLLREEPGVEVIGECADGFEAVTAVERLKPELLFLDVQMPRLDGFGVIEALETEALPVVIFTTAHDQHAIRAFEVNALDYLLKPFKESRFRKAMDRVRAQLRERSGVVSEPGLGALLSHLRANQSGGPRLLIKSPERILFLKTEEIDYLEAAGNYAVVHSGSERHIVRDTMAALEKRLAPAGFMRLSRSVIVNLHRIRELQPLEAGVFCAILRSGARLSMTCSLREVQERMAEL